MSEHGDHGRRVAERFNLPELTDLARVSVRTVRYYINEGLLPPPVAAGVKSYYTRAHLDRLTLIGWLKAARLPLREIRRRLDGLSDDAVHDLAHGDATAALYATGGPFVEEKHAAHGHHAPPHAGDDLMRPSAPPPPGAAREMKESASDYIARFLPRREPRSAPPPSPTVEPRPSPGRPCEPDPDQDQEPTFPLRLPVDDERPDLNAESPAWRRVHLTDNAELLIRDDVYRRKRDKIDWLISWARRVLD